MNVFLFNPFMMEADTRSKSMDWFLYDIGLRHERVKVQGSVYARNFIVSQGLD